MGCSDTRVGKEHNRFPKNCQGRQELTKVELIGKPISVSRSHVNTGDRATLEINWIR